MTISYNLFDNDWILKIKEDNNVIKLFKSIKFFIPFLNLYKKKAIIITAYETHHQKIKHNMKLEML